MSDYHCIGWTRSGKNKGMVLRYHLKKVCNTITSFAGGASARTIGQECITPHHTY